MNANFNCNNLIKRTFRINSFASTPSFKSKINNDIFEAKSTEQLISEIKTALEESRKTYFNMHWQLIDISSDISDDISQENDKKIKQLRAEIKKSANYQVELRKKLQYLEKKLIFEQHACNPRTQFIYNPDLSEDEIKKIAEETEGIYRVSNIASKLGTTSTFFDKLAREDVITIDSYKRNQYIDVLSEKNKPLFDEFFEAKERGKLINASNFALRYNYYGFGVAKAVNNGEIKLLGADKFKEMFNSTSYDSFLIDLSNPINIEGVKKHMKLTPIQDNEIFNAPLGKLPPVSVNYLAKLGYGTPKQIAKLVESGYLNGYIKTQQTHEGEKKQYYVNLATNMNVKKLLDMREQNPNTVDMMTFAKMLGVTKAQLKEMTLSGEIEIIPRYIFNEDYCKVFYSLNNSKNKSALDKKLFEKELITKHKKGARSEDTFRMKIAWYFAPKTRKIAKELAKNDGYLKYILKKLDDGASLSDKEHIKLLSYYKEMWNRAGIEEYQSALELSSIIYKEYKAKGIETIDNPKLREFILGLENRQE